MSVEVRRKPIKNLNLSVNPPNGRVKVSAPMHMELETIRAFVASKLSWIRRQQQKIQNQPREAPREFVQGENHSVYGKRHQLKIIESNQKSRVEIDHNILTMYVRPGQTRDKREELLNAWYRSQLKQDIPPLICQYEALMNVAVSEFGVKCMKTRWGTCNTVTRRIWFNLELAKKPPECLEYIVVHEMVHLLERSHNHRFKSLMELYLPKWKHYKDELNRSPISHENWNF